MMKRTRQEGSALFISLMLLVVMTLLGITAMQTNMLQERMSGNMRDVNLALQAAEAGLRDAELYLQDAVLPAFNGNDGLYQMTTGVPALWETVDWEDDARIFTGELGGVAGPPRYVIEELPVTQSTGGSLAADEPATDQGWYRVTARGVGGSDVAVVILQTTYRR